MRRLLQILTVLVFAVVLGLMAWVGWVKSGGAFVYTLDDPYIHLAVGENLLRGGYGINLEEPSSPSSSVLYPFLMALGLAVGLGDLAPLVVSSLAAAGALWLFAGELFDALYERAPSWVVVAFLPLPLVLSVNAVGLCLTGMEHTLHLLGVGLVFSALPRDGGGGLDVGRLWIGALLCSVVRFEGLALGLGALALAASWGHWRAAVGGLAAVGGVLGGFGLWMRSLGLPLLPSSVLVKSEAAASAVDDAPAAVLLQLLTQVGLGLGERFGVLLALASLALGWAAIGASGPRRSLAALATFALTAHLVFGRYGWYARYEVYAVAIALLACLRTFAPVWRSSHEAVRTLGIATALAVVGAPYAWITVESPSAMVSIHEQQHQLHRFVTAHLPRTVAVNDLGWVSYRNDGYVLDLWGLGSERVRRLTRGRGRTPELLDELVRSKGVTYAMIYPAWFRGVLPESWCPIATLTTSKVSSDSGIVGFYLIDLEEEAAMREALAAFRPGLPPGATLEVGPCP